MDAFLPSSAENWRRYLGAFFILGIHTMKKETKPSRRIYQEETGQPIPHGFHVHHIDFNKGNDDINNMVAIPKELHQEYHTLVNSLHDFNAKDNPYYLRVTYSKEIILFAECINKMDHYIQTKEQIIIYKQK